MTADTVGGVWHYAIELATRLAQRGVRVALATMGAPLTPLQHAQVARVPQMTLFESAYALEWMSDPWIDVERAGAWLLELEHDLDPHVVHLNQFAFGSLPFAAPKLVVAHSCVLSWWSAVHGSAVPAEWNEYRSRVASGLGAAALVAAPTRAMLRTLRENYGYKGEGIVIPNGRDAAQYRPAAKHDVIFAAGRLWDCAKNLAALEAVAPALPWPVRVAGPTAHPDGGVRAPVNVHVLGELAPNDLAGELSRAAIYALPARYEPFGLSVLEAALSGCALVLGDIPSLREVWGRAAVYVKPDDHTALREALAQLIREPRRRERLARAARDRALLYTPERKAAAYLAAYEALTGAAAASSSALPSESHACAS